MPQTELKVASDDLLPVPVGSPDRHPVAVYLARLAPGSRRSQQAALETISSLLTNGRIGIEELPLAKTRLSAHPGLTGCTGRTIQPGDGKSAPCSSAGRPPRSVATGNDER